MKNILIIVQIIVALAVSSLILLQAKGTGLGRAFGQSTYHSKRGVEFIVFRLTIALATIFVLVSLISQILI